MIFKRSQRYYLKKIEEGILTCKQVAEELGISKDIVEKEYKDYFNPFSDKKAERRSGNIQILISILSALIVLFTLFEMQAERNMAYRPDVYFSFNIPAEGIQNTWNDGGELIESTIDTYSVPIQLQNIGVGTAKNIDFDWNWDDNLETYTEVINRGKYSWVFYNSSQIFLRNMHPEIKDDEEREEICKQETSVIFGNYRKSDAHLDYLLSSEDKTQTIWFPYEYYELVQEAILAKKTSFIPAISLDVSYCDIQGKKYQKTYQITPHVTMWQESSDGMTCLFDFNVNEVKTMGIWDCLSKFNDLATVITAIIALIVSVVALRDSHKFSRLQREHNVKSVKPIATVETTDTPDIVRVVVKNAGMGPMFARGIKFHNSESESDNIRDIVTPFSGWTCKITGNETIVPNEELLVLLAETENTKNTQESLKLLKSCLAETTIILEFADIYDNTYTFEETLVKFKK